MKKETFNEVDIIQELISLPKQVIYKDKIYTKKCEVVNDCFEISYVSKIDQDILFYHSPLRNEIELKDSIQEMKDNIQEIQK